MCEYSSGVSRCIDVKANKDVKLHAVRLFGNADDVYSVELKVKDSNGFVLATKEGRFVSKRVHSDIGDYQGFDIVFDQPIAFKANSGYVRFEGKISGPRSYCGGSGLSRIEHSGVVFSFNSCSSGFHSSVQSGQFPEFLFSLV